MAASADLDRVKIWQDIEIASGAVLDVNGTWKIGGTQVTVSAAEINALASTGLSATELGYLDDVTAGLVTASKAVVVDSSKDIGDFRNLDAVNFDAGSSGTAGTVDIFPTTGTSGKWTLTCAAQAGNTAVETRVAQMGQATTLTIPDPGASSASFVLTAGNQTVGGTKTFSATVATSANVGAAGTGVAATEYGEGTIHQTVLTLTLTGANDYDLADGNDDAGKTVYTFPQGRIAILGAVSDLSVATPAPVDEVQTLTVTATAGTYTLTFGAEETGNIDWNANAATITSGLEALTGIGATNCTATGVGPFTLTFANALAGKDVALITASAGASVELATPGSGGVTGNFYVGAGSTEATDNNGDLATTEQNVIGKMTLTQSASAAGHGVDAGSILYLDGTTTAAPLWLNVAMPTSSVTAGGSTVAVTGTLTVSWIKLGDY